MLCVGGGVRKCEGRILRAVDLRGCRRGGGRWQGTCNAPSPAAIIVREVAWKITELKVDVAWRCVCCIFMKVFNKALHSASGVEARDGPLARVSTPLAHPLSYFLGVTTRLTRRGPGQLTAGRRHCIKSGTRTVVVRVYLLPQLIHYYWCRSRGDRKSGEWKPAEDCNGGMSPYLSQ